MTTWLSKLDPVGSGLRVAVKDIIDVAGLPTTAGCAVVAARALPADADAACLAAIRASGAAIVGKTNLHELACGGTGVNPHFGTPVNPLDPSLIPGGSSSGSAVAVATGEADLALGTDTAGSIRTPSACCGTVGLKLTWGGARTEGLWPLAPSLDAIGPMAADVAGVVRGMELLDPAFAPRDDPSPAIGRVRIPDVDPRIDAAVDELLATSELDVVDIELPGWKRAERAAWTVLLYELWRADGGLMATDGDRLGADVRRRIRQGRAIRPAAYGLARLSRAPWRQELANAFARAPLLAWPTLSFFPTPLGDPAPNTSGTNLVVNFAGHPALALPIPTDALPASVQLVGPDGSEPLLCATAARLEAAAS